MGNKLDKNHEREVQNDEARQFAKEHGFQFMEISATKKDEVEDLFKEIVYNICAKDKV